MLIGLLLTVYCLAESAAYFIHIDANEEQCFFDRVTAGTKMGLIFEVAEGGFLDIDVKVKCFTCFRLFVELIKATYKLLFIE